MKQLTFLFYGEGKRDIKFLPALINRVIEKCMLNLVKEYEILPIVTYSKRFQGSFKSRMEELQVIGENFDFILIHQDTDDRSEANLMEYKWRPWSEQCVKIESWVPVFPVHMTDTWILADKEALCFVLDISEREYNAQLNGRRLENISDPKPLLENLIDLSENWGINDIYDSLPKEISLEKLDSLKSFSTFRERLCNAISSMENNKD